MVSENGALLLKFQSCRLSGHGIIHPRAHCHAHTSVHPIVGNLAQVAHDVYQHLCATCTSIWHYTPEHFHQQPTQQTCGGTPPGRVWEGASQPSGSLREWRSESLMMAARLLRVVLAAANKTKRYAINLIANL